uniref:Uncharacterized protein n=1 Tax=Chromera velia CCMP2878 TaxID=1169474 RepID=A0A0K6S6F4_9ALVE|eukprot:Cvel_15880.t1-p1 / transcript=Cvel_15880.t1 / gene=Cvel_15880 / organism=Chromera_velia_CCMP2878 / gene_product=hypothetical protein / transcript_product=hypothetical protein / location=Cvel_scaffold1198:25752-26270(-) / protein_length=173 / sequence_SO=supercontig / SO=protein_coding / is_pseudo=false
MFKHLGGQLFGGRIGPEQGTGPIGAGLFAEAQHRPGGVCNQQQLHTGGVFGHPGEMLTHMVGAVGGQFFADQTVGLAEGGMWMREHYVKTHTRTEMPADLDGLQALLGPPNPEDSDLVCDVILHARPALPEPVPENEYTRTPKMTTLWKPLVEPSFKTGGYRHGSEYGKAASE